MKTWRLWLLFLIILSACMPIAPTPLPSQTPLATADDLALYRPALIASRQNDITLVEHATRYNLTLNYDPSITTLSGAQDVRYWNKENVALKEIYFRLFANYADSGGKITVSNLTVNDKNASYVHEVQETALRVVLDKPLEPNASTNIHLDFSVTVPRSNKLHYNDFVAVDSVTTMPSVYPLIPAYDAKGWHIELPPAHGDLVYADLSMYAVTMTVPSAMTVIASGTTTQTRENGNGTTTWQMVGALMRDFDLNVTTQLDKISETVGETTVNSWYEPADAEAGKNALKFAGDALKLFNERFGVYPYRELDIVETPTTAGGIEYPGIVTIGKSLYRDARQREFFEFATAHEVSHQWWYGMVGNDQVNSPWVDEALAQYSTLIYYQDLKGQGAANVILRNYFTVQYDNAKKAGRDAPVNLPVSAYDDNDYGAIVYGKGPLFYDAIRKKMGDEKFYRFLKTLFETYRYKRMTGEAILKTAEQVHGASLQDEYNTWILSPAK